ncbi:cellulase family glycosylhydrolase [bacterium]|nr:cellulase family glycosylhydrolase [bacterium]
MKKPGICCIFFPLLLVAENRMVNFYAVNSVTWEEVTPDSIYVQNVTGNSDTLLTASGPFDLNLLSAKTSAPQAGPDRFGLSDNYPNPFTERTRIQMTVPQKDEISIRVYNILGQCVAESRSRVPEGIHDFQLECGKLGSGVYFLQVTGRSETRTLKMLKLGHATTGQAALRYTGPRTESRFFKSRRVSAGLFRFTLYADGFYPATLDNQSPADGDLIHFDLMPLPPPDDFTSHWFGFNLLGKFTLEWSNTGYSEQDFQMIHELGFTFVRLPIDYRTFTEPDDWTAYVPEELADIDNAVTWGQAYGIHVCINLHRAPGYCVNPPSQSLPSGQNVSLWNNALAQAAFAAQWRMFAERYREIPDDALSFNLVNEPSGTDGGTYVNAVLPAIQAIRDISPGRIIISDGIDWGNAQVDEILDYGVVMSPHFYNPFQLTHYRAEWADGSDSWPVPEWPPELVSNYFYGSWKSPWNTRMEIDGHFPEGTGIRLLVNQVSTVADFQATADGEIVFSHHFEPGPGTGEWEQVIYNQEWDTYQNIYNREYAWDLESDAVRLSLGMANGDWMTFNALHIEPPAGSGLSAIHVQPGISDWGVPQAAYRVENGTLIVQHAPEGFEDLFKMNGFLDPWIILKQSGTPVHVGEWGVYNKTPHDVTLRFMANRLNAMKSAGLGWALWNFRGSFGILDSGRQDVVYETWHGHQLDRDMLDLLLEYVD